jgi:hypothetical protein
MPRYSFIAGVSTPLTGPLSVGTTPAANAVLDKHPVAAQAKSAQMNSFRSEAKLRDAPVCMVISLRRLSRRNQCSADLDRGNRFPAFR